MICLLAMLAACLVFGAPVSASGDATGAALSPWTGAVPEVLQEAVAAYEDGRFLEVLESADGIERSTRLEPGRDDADMLRALALVALGWDGQAEARLHSILEATPPSPYYPLALLQLVEIHHEAGRWEAVAEAYGRHFEEPWTKEDESSRRIRKLLADYGTLRSGTAELSPAEKQRLANPEELEVRLEDRRERITDRILYLSGTALLRMREHDRSLRALRRIGIESLYYPYALYSIALDQIALHNEIDDSGIVDRLMSLEADESAITVLQRLVRYPEPDSHGVALDGKARLLLARLLLRAGDVDEGVRMAMRLPENDPLAEEGRLLVAGTLLGSGEPALALVYAKVNADGEEKDVASLDGFRSVETIAHRGLILGRAYVELGDRKRAVRTYRAAMREVRETDGVSVDRAAARLRALLTTFVKDERSRRARARQHLGRGIRQVFAYEGWGPWWSPGRIRRGVEEALGARPWGILARGRRPDVAFPVATDRLWLDFLGSAEREDVAGVLDRLIDLEPRANTADTALRVLDAYLFWIVEAGGTSDPELRDVVHGAGRYVDELRRRHGFGIPPLRLDTESPLEPQIEAYRARLLGAGISLPSEGSVGAAAIARVEVVDLLHRRMDQQIRSFLGDRERRLQALELRLDQALARTLARRPRGSSTTEPP